MVANQQYKLWLELLFNHAEEEGDWVRSCESNKQVQDQLDAISPHEVVDFFIQCCENFTNDVAHYSDWQVSQAITYIMNPDFSNYSFHIRDQPACIEIRLKAIKSIHALFEHCFNIRCSNALFNRSIGGNPLDNTCYDFWHDSPLTYCVDDFEKNSLNKAVLQTLSSCLDLPNLACKQSSLRGLSNLSRTYPAATKIITEFIKNNSNEHSTLLDYAQAAADRRIH